MKKSLKINLLYAQTKNQVQNNIKNFNLQKSKFYMINFLKGCLKAEINKLNKI